MHKIETNEIENYTKQYVQEKDGHYVKPIYIQLILENSLSMSWDKILDIVENAKVNLSFHQIQEYMDMKNTLQRKIKEQTKNDVIPLNCKSFIQVLRPVTLEYFEKYIAIVKEKCIDFIHIIYNLQLHYLNVNEENRNDYLKKVLCHYDIKLNEKGEIYYPDLIRLLIPFISNLRSLKEKVEQANDLDTYLFFTISKEKLYSDLFTEEELLPRRELQVKNLNFMEEGYIPLSDKQKEQLYREEQIKNSNILTFINQISMEPGHAKIFI